MVHSELDLEPVFTYMYIHVVHQCGCIVFVTSTGMDLLFIYSCGANLSPASWPHDQNLDAFFHGSVITCSLAGNVNMLTVKVSSPLPHLYFDSMLLRFSS